VNRGFWNRWPGPIEFHHLTHQTFFYVFTSIGYGHRLLQ
jgi:hypothetical protein